MVWEKATTFCNNFRVHNLYNSAMIPPQVKQRKWSKPPDGYLKTNFDTPWENHKVGFGFIVRGDDGFVHGGGCGVKNDVANVEWAEADGFIQSVLWAK